MTAYIALLRGINVGGKNFIKMAELKEALVSDGFENVTTYIQSGNVIFSSQETSKTALARKFEKSIEKYFSLNVDVVVLSKSDWQKIVSEAPAWWGKDGEWKHNLLVLLPPYDMDEVVSAVGELKPEIEAMSAGDGVLYQSMSKKLFGRTTTGKLASNPIYKRMTIRNYNTTKKLEDILSELN